VNVSSREGEDEAPLADGLHNGFWGGDFGVTHASGEFLRCVSDQSPRDAETVISGLAPGESSAGLTETPARLYLVLKKPRWKSPRKSGGRGGRAAPANLMGYRRKWRSLGNRSRKNNLALNFLTCPLLLFQVVIYLNYVQESWK